MPRRTSHPLGNLLRALGWSGSSEEMETPLGDVLQANVNSDDYDPSFDTYGFGFTTPTPGAGLHARVRIFFDREVVAYRLRSLATPRLFAAGTLVRTTNIPETADPILATAPEYRSRAPSPPFRVREDDVLTAAAAPAQGWYFGGREGAEYRGDQLFNNCIWTDAQNALEFVNNVAATPTSVYLFLDVLLTG